MHHRQITGVEPAAGKGFLGGSRIFQVTLHDRVTAQHQLPHRFAVGGRLLHGRGVQHAGFLHHRRADALPRHEGGLFVDRQCVQARLPEADGGRAIALGQSIQMCDSEAHRLHLRDNRRWRRGTAGGDFHGLVE